MEAFDYQNEAARTLIDEPGFDIPGNDMMIIWCALGLAGEAGEVVDMIKKGILHQHGINDEKLEEEIGDVCWYIAGICTVLGYDLGQIMQENIDKLKIRYPNGFSSEDSKKRIDKK
jgi:NTP pyrophosphatase (non-canonical NTP hydrolase)